MDHFERMRREPEPQAEHDADAPLVLPALIEYLERVYAIPVPVSTAKSMDQAIEASTHLARMVGQQEVLAHLRTLLRTS